jgi:DnaK suppressor protein
MQARRVSRTKRKPKATTKDIVGDIPKSERVPERWRKYYGRLIQLRGHLLNQRVALAKDAIEENPTFSTHMADAGTDVYDRDFALGMLSTDQDALYQVEQALDRIRNGTYGYCELTGKPIEPGRLEAIPWTRFSLAAEKKLEAEGKTKTARLGPRESVMQAGAPED